MPEEHLAEFVEVVNKHPPAILAKARRMTLGSLDSWLSGVLRDRELELLMLDLAQPCSGGEVPIQSAAADELPSSQTLCHVYPSYWQVFWRTQQRRA